MIAPPPEHDHRSLPFRPAASFLLENDENETFVSRKKSTEGRGRRSILGGARASFSFPEHIDMLNMLSVENHHPETCQEKRPSIDSMASHIPERQKQKETRIADAYVHASNPKSDHSKRFIVAQGLRRTPRSGRKKGIDGKKDRFGHMRDQMRQEDRDKSNHIFAKEYEHRCTIFEKFDPHGDGSGSLDVPILVELLRAEQIFLSAAEVGNLIRQCDMNSNYLIEWKEFQFFLWKATHRHQLKLMTLTLPMENKELLDSLFFEFDSAGQGGLTVSDVFDMSKFLKMELSLEEVEVVVDYMDADGNGTIEKEELIFFFDEINTRNDLRVQMKRAAASGENTTDFLETVFDKFDTHNKGRLDGHDLFAIMQFLKLDFTPHAIEELIRVVDLDGNGTIELDEFLIFFSTVRQWSELREQLKAFGRSRIRARRCIRGFFAINFVSAVVLLSFGASTPDTSMIVIGIVCGFLAFIISVSFIGFKKVGKMVKRVFFECTWRKLLFLNAIATWMLIAMVLTVVVDSKVGAKFVPVILLCVVAVIVLSGWMAQKYFQDKHEMVEKSIGNKPGFSKFKQSFSKSRSMEDV